LKDQDLGGEILELSTRRLSYYRGVPRAAISLTQVELVSETFAARIGEIATGSFGGYVEFPGSYHLTWGDSKGIGCAGEGPVLDSATIVCKERNLASSFKSTVQIPG
jgi:hypothetical protein